MRLFPKKPQADGWLALVPQGAALAAASVTRRPGAKPAVRLATLLPGAERGALERAGRALHARHWRCSTVLAPGQYQMLALDAPAVPPDELRSAVRWRLKDVLDFPVQEAAIDVLPIPAANGAPARQGLLFAIAARRSVVAQRQAEFARARIGLAAIDIPEMAQRNIAALLETPGRGLAMLSLDGGGALLTVSYQGELYLARRIDVSPDHLDQGAPARMEQCEKITLALQRSLDHVERQFNFISVARLLLAPSPVRGLDDDLARNLGIPVASFDLAAVFDLAGAPALASSNTSAMQQQLFIALGAALRDEGAAP